jgi:hypothetical protein
MKKGAPIVWDQACQNALEDIKKYLTNPLVLCHYMLGALLAQNNDDGKEMSLYYLSGTLLEAECNYPDIEKICLSLVFAAQKLCHYMLEHTIHLVSRADPLSYILSKMTLSRMMAKWAMLLSQFDIVFIPQKALKGQALANFLAAHPIPYDFPIDDDLPDEEIFATITGNSSWQMYFDGACRRSGASAAVDFVTPDEVMADGLHKCKVSMMIPINPTESWLGSVVGREPDTGIKMMADIALTSLCRDRLATTAALPIVLNLIWN